MALKRKIKYKEHEVTFPEEIQKMQNINFMLLSQGKYCATIILLCTCSRKKKSLSVVSKTFPLITMEKRKKKKKEEAFSFS